MSAEYALGRAYEKWTGAGSNRRHQDFQERAEHEMHRVAEEHMALSRQSGIQQRLQFLVEKPGLIGDMFLQVFLGGTGIARTRCQRNPRSFKNRRT